MTAPNFFSELKRRNVIRAGGLYLVGAWLLIQVASTMLPAFDAPAWILRSLIITLAVCFIPALIFSWVFELTPQGLKRDEDVSPAESIAPQTARRMDRMIIVVLVLALGYFCFDKFILAPRREAAMLAAATVPNEHKSSVPTKSIAVLPFQNLSEDKSNAYFSEGIQDEILTRLSKLGALKVISRTSTAHYASTPQNLPQIAQQLGVANILEGSVQKVNDTVRVNVQLIRAATDDHLWAESYDRKLTDIFGVEAEVAQNIASSLNAKLTGAEQQMLAQKPTGNSAAYEAYLRGLAFQGRIDDLLPNIRKSIEAFNEAVELDPNFALALAQLSRQSSFLFAFADKTPHNREVAQGALEKAQGLGPNLVETKLADGCYRYWVARDYEGAKNRLEAVRREYPNDHFAAEILAAIARRQGQWEESRRLFAQAIDHNPQDIFLLAGAALTDIAMRDTAAAQKILQHARDLNPENSAVIQYEALSYEMTGDVTRAQVLLEQAHPAQDDFGFVIAMVQNAILSRNYGPAFAIVKARLKKPEALSDQLDAFENLLGDLQRNTGDLEAAAVSYRRARDANEASRHAQPDNPDVVMTLSWTEAHLDDKAVALTDAKQAIALLPASRDAWIGPAYEENLARIEAFFGDKDSAIAALQHLLQIPYADPVTPALLRLDPDWDNLRDDSRFEKLVAQPFRQTK